MDRKKFLAEFLAANSKIAEEVDVGPWRKTARVLAWWAERPIFVMILFFYLAFAALLLRDYLFPAGPVYCPRYRY
jgi:hypothetical protein